MQNLTQLGGGADCLRPSIFSRVSGRMQFRNGSDSESTSNFVPILKKV
jgi:hypothetical protein